MSEPETKVEIAEAPKIEEPITEVETVPETKAEAKPESKVEATPEAKVEATPEVKTETASEAKVEAKAEAKTEAKTEAKSEVKSEEKKEKSYAIEEILEGPSTPSTSEVREAAEGETVGQDKAEGESGGKGKQSRSEKKARKAIQKLGMKQVTGIGRVTLRRGKNELIVISKPDVFKNPSSDTYIIFGQAKLEDMSTSDLTKKAKEVFEAEAPSAPSGAHVETAGKVQEAVKIEEVGAGGEEEVADETGLEAKDIELVINQTNVSRAKACKALRAHKGDIVNAIMELTM